MSEFVIFVGLVFVHQAYNSFYMAEEGNIVVRRAKVNNLKDITVEIPRGKFVVITGISGSGRGSQSKTLIVY